MNVLVMQLHLTCSYAFLPRTLLMTNCAPFASLGEQFVDTCTVNERINMMTFLNLKNYVMIFTFWLVCKQVIVN